MADQNEITSCSYARCLTRLLTCMATASIG